MLLFSAKALGSGNIFSDTCSVYSTEYVKTMIDDALVPVSPGHQ